MKNLLFLGIFGTISLSFASQFVDRIELPSPFLAKLIENQDIHFNCFAKKDFNNNVDFSCDSSLQYDRFLEFLKQYCEEKARLNKEEDTEPVDPIVPTSAVTTEE